MSQSSGVRIVLGTWEDLRDDAYLIRHEVFVVEQAVPAEIELDDDDACSVHAVAYDSNHVPVATGRLLPDGHIGRMAVRKLARGSGVGGQVLQALIEQGQGDGHRTLLLNAQTHARRFYEMYGFTGYGEEFLDAGIVHIAMSRELAE